MALVIVSTKVGKKGERKFRIIVREKRSKRDGKFVDMLGWYEKGKDKNVDMKKYNYWMSQGAKPSHTIAKVVTA